MSRFSRRAFAGLTLAACVAGCNAVENVKEVLPKRNTEDAENDQPHVFLLHF